MIPLIVFTIIGIVKKRYEARMFTKRLVIIIRVNNGIENINISRFSLMLSALKFEKNKKVFKGKMYSNIVIADPVQK